MKTDPNQPDEALDQVLAALSNAPPPENMHARIAQRLQHASPTAPAPSRLRSLLFGVTPTAAQPFRIWARGALTGAACAAVLTFCAGLLIQHRSFTPAQPQTSTTIATPQPSTLQVDLPSQSPSTSQPESIPCTQRATIRRTHSSAARNLSLLRTTYSIQPVPLSHPAPALPLTAEERQLVRLVRTASPAALASLNPEVEAKREAEDSAEFTKFFAPPPPPPPPAEAASTTAPILNN